MPTHRLVKYPEISPIGKKHIEFEKELLQQNKQYANNVDAILELQNKDNNK